MDACVPTLHHVEPSVNTVGIGMLIPALPRGDADTYSQQEQCCGDTILIAYGLPVAGATLPPSVAAGHFVWFGVRVLTDHRVVEE